MRRAAPSLPRTLRRVLRLVAWNLVFTTSGLVLVALIGEAWLRSTVPFNQKDYPRIFVPGVGLVMPPDTEVRWTNRLDFWTVSRTNSLGFLDREPPSPERAAESCHVTMIGDSFVEAKEVRIPEKSHVLLEERAALELPRLDVTTSAFGVAGTGQINQLAWWEEYVRPLRPGLLVLVFVPNDYANNFPLWTSLWRDLDPEHLPYVSAARAEDGGFRLRPPDPDYRRFMLSQRFRPQEMTLRRQAYRASWFWSWLGAKRFKLLRSPGSEKSHRKMVRRKEVLKQRRPSWAPLLDEWQIVMEDVRTRPANEGIPSVHALFREESDSPFLKEALAFTAFGLDEWKKRAERDGAALVILASHRMRRYGEGTFARMNEMAAERSIPVIDQADFIYRQGAELRDAEWAHDGHWSPRGHRWAAEALLEYLERNQDVCE